MVEQVATINKICDEIDTVHFYGNNVHNYCCDNTGGEVTILVVTS